MRSRSSSEPHYRRRLAGTSPIGSGIFQNQGSPSLTGVFLGEVRLFVNERRFFLEGGFASSVPSTASKAVDAAADHTAVLMETPRAGRAPVYGRPASQDQQLNMSSSTISSS